MTHTAANYLQHHARRKKPSINFGRFLFSSVAFLLAVFVFTAGLNFSSLVAFADDGDEDAYSGVPGMSDVIGDHTPEDAEEEIFGNTTKNPARNTFASLIQRFFIPSYINYTPDAYLQGNVADDAAEIGWNTTHKLCNVDHPGAGTVVYHNCDVPNVSAEFVQTVYSLFDTSGVLGHVPRNSVSTLFPGFGQSKNLPDETVPANVAGGSYKYTALEVFGYDLPLTYYNGEWDNIHTLTTARLLANFSVFDTVGMTAKALGNSIAEAFNRVGQLAANGWGPGGIFGTIAGFFTGMVAATVNSALDTSDANVVLSNGWYRSNFAMTAYGMRQLSNQEIDAMLRQSFLAYMSDSMPEDRTYDDWLHKTDPTAPLLNDPPKLNISKCVLNVHRAGSGATTREATTSGTHNNTTAPGLTQTECQNEQNKENTARWNSYYCYGYVSGYSDANGCIVLYDGEYYQKTTSADTSEVTPGTDNGKWKLVTKSGFGLSVNSWTVDGNQKAESFNTWFTRIKNTAGDWDGNIAKYEIQLVDPSCTPANPDSTSGTIPQTAYTNWVNYCWTGPWTDASIANEIEQQTSQNTIWLKSLLTPEVLAEWASLPENKGKFDFNSPWSRYICLNPDGTTVTNGTYEDSISGGSTGAPILVPVYNKDGSINSDCKAASDQEYFRPPIQGALFGSGYDYTTDSQTPEIDTRHINNFYGPQGILIGAIFLQPTTALSQAVFAAGQLFTQISNELITWTYAPLLETWGVYDIVINLVDGFKEGIFFELAILVIALAGLYILYQAGVHRKYREGFVSAFYLALIFIVGGVLMARTADVVHIVDRVPANVEKAVMGLVLSNALTDDNICSTDTTGAVTDDADLDALKNIDVFEESTSTGDPLDLFSNTYSSADDPLRSMLCINWRAFVLEPWAFAQWGTSISNLDTEDMLNTNEGLVGDASVDLGGSNGVENNWGIYQLYTTKLGSSETVDLSIQSSQTRFKDFYRIVDMQAGPNNGAGTDSRYLQTWSGADPLSRLGVALLSTFSSGLALLVVGAYSFSKILVSFLSVMLILGLPFVFLVGLFPSKRGVVKNYLLTILGLMIQRVALVLVLCIFFLLLLSFMTAADSYQSIFILMVIICLIFWKFRKKILGFSVLTGGGTAKGVFGKARETVEASKNAIPPTIRHQVERNISALRYGIPGAAFGVVNGKTPYDAFLKAAQPRDEILRRKQRAEGLGIVERIQYDTSGMRQSFMRKSTSDPRIHRARELVKNSSPEMQDYHTDLESYRKEIADYYKDLEGVVGAREKDIPVLDANGNPTLDRNGNEVMEKGIVVPHHDPDTGEEINSVLRSRPKPPVAPVFEDKEFSYDQMVKLNQYAALTENQESLLKKRDALRESLYATRGGKSVIESLPKKPKPEDIEKAINESLGDRKGYTEIQRKQMRKALDALEKLDVKLEEGITKMNQLSNEILQDELIFSHANDDVNFMGGLIDDINARAAQILDERNGERDNDAK